MKAEQFPIVVKEWGVSATVHRTSQIKNGRQYVSYVVAYFLLGKRKREWHADLDRARNAALDACRRVANGEQCVLQLGNQDRLIYLRAIEALKPAGVPLDLAAAEFAQALAVLRGAGSVLDAARDFVARHPVSLAPIQIPDAVEAFMNQAQADRKSRRRQKDFSGVLGRFALSFNVEAQALTPKLISEYLRTLPFRERTKRNHRDVISLFTRWLVLQGYRK